MTGALRDGTSRPVAFWLVPAAEPRARLDIIIADLARAFDAPLFEPHVTLHVGEQMPDDDLEALLARVAASTAPIELTAASTGHSPARFKTLFIEFEPDARPRALHEALRAGLARRASYALRPHLSLLYKELPKRQRVAIAVRHDFLGERIVFDRIAAVEPGGGDWANVGAWTARMRMPLG